MMSLIYLIFFSFISSFHFVCQAWYLTKGFENWPFGDMSLICKMVVENDDFVFHLFFQINSLTLADHVTFYITSFNEKKLILYENLDIMLLCKYFMFLFFEF